MDIANRSRPAGGGCRLCTLILMGGDLRMFLDVHAAIVILCGSFAATLILFPLSSIFHGIKPCRKCRKSPRRRSTSCSRRRSRVSTSRLSTKPAVPCFPKAARYVAEQTRNSYFDARGTADAGQFD